MKEKEAYKEYYKAGKDNARYGNQMLREELKRVYKARNNIIRSLYKKSGHTYLNELRESENIGKLSLVAPINTPVSDISL